MSLGNCNILYSDYSVRLYRPELRNLSCVRSIVSAIILSQLEYWHFKSKDGFYKFLEPCSHQAYREGDSWTEELNCTVSEFRSAYNHIGVKYPDKTSFDQEADPFKGKFYAAYTNKRTGFTYYFRNSEKLDSELASLYFGGTEVPQPESSQVEVPIQHEVQNSSSRDIDSNTATITQNTSEITHKDEREKEKKEKPNHKNQNNSKTDIKQVAPDPYWVGNQERIINLQRDRAFKESLGNGPWQSVEEKSAFRHALTEFAQQSGKRNPGGFAKSILDDMAKEGYNHPYWEQWKAGEQIGEHERQEWEAFPGKPYPYFLQYLQTELKRQDYSDAQALEQANWICQQPQRAQPHWEQFKIRVSREAETKAKNDAHGVQGYVAPKYLRDQTVSQEDAIAAIGHIKQSEAPTLTASASSYSQLKEEVSRQQPQPKEEVSRQQPQPKEEVSRQDQQEQSTEVEKDAVTFLKEELSSENFDKKWQSSFGRFMRSMFLQQINQATSEEQATCWKLLLDNPITHGWASTELANDFDF